MEKIYDVARFRASENLNAADYFTKYREICCPRECSAMLTFLKLSEDVLNETGVNVNELECICHPDNLRIQNEPLNVPMPVPEKVSTKTKCEYYYPINDESKKLNVIRAKEALELRWTAAEYKFSGKRFIKASIPKTVELDDGSNIVPGSDFIYSIIIYRPCSIHHGQRNSGEKLRFTYEIEALGSNLLSDVVDNINCMSNSRIIKEVENTSVDLTQFKNAKKWYPSQTVFIDGIFYNDTRSLDAADLSPEVIKWAKDKNIGKFTTAKMQETLLSNLTPRLGYPYVYIHQADCEHIFVFSDVRLLQNNDCLNAQKYPKVVSFNRSYNVMCIICTLRISQWMVTKCNKFPQEKVFLCTECCNSYLYLDGEKVTDFKLYPCFDQKEY